MRVFQVSFQSNKAVSASFVGYSFSSAAEIERNENKRFIKTLTVIADSEQESMEIAEKVVADYFGFL